METINKRIKTLRENLGMTLEEFGKGVGVTKVAIHMLEKEGNNISKRMILSICKTYNVNQNWLETGEGDMFVELTPEEEVMKFVAETHALPEDDPRVILLRTIANMSPEEWDVVDLMIKHIKENKKEGC